MFKENIESPTQIHEFNMILIKNEVESLLHLSIYLKLQKLFHPLTQVTTTKIDKIKDTNFFIKKLISLLLVYNKLIVIKYRFHELVRSDKKRN